VEQAKEEWEEIVTSPPNSHQIQGAEELEGYLRKTCNFKKLHKGRTKISLGGSACFESGRKTGGKTGFARELLEQAPFVLRVDLESGASTEEKIFPREKPGEFLFHRCLDWYKSNPDYCKIAFMTTVDEIGQKVRPITVPVFVHSTILSPWAHIIYNYLVTSREARSGIRGSNHGWTLCLDLSASNGKLSWLFDGRPVGALLSDLKSATDLAFHDTVGMVCDVLQQILQFPTWYSGVVKDLLASPRTVYFDQKCLASRSIVTTRGCFMGDQGAKVILTASGLLALSRMKGPRVSRIVGDDHATICDMKNIEENARIYRSTMEEMGYQLSELDSYISNYCFFTEEVFRIETNPSLSLETFLSGRQGRINYLDYPRVRLLSDVSSNIRSSNNTLSGKIGLMGKHMEYSGKNTLVFSLCHLASWIQDLCCSLLHKPEFVYFPRSLVVSSKPILFRHPQNFERFIRMQKEGRLLGNYSDLMWRATARSSSTRAAISSQFDHRSNIFLRVSDTKRSIPPELEEYSVMNTLNQRGVVPFIIGRLGDKLISDTEITMKIMENEFLFDERLPVPAIVETLSERKREFHQEEFELFLQMWKENSVLLRFNYLERYFKREEVENFLENNHPLRVDIPLGVIPPVDEDTPSMSLESLEIEREKEILWEWVLTNPQNLETIPRRIIKDDLAIVRDNPDILSRPRILLVSDDRALISHLANLRGLNWRSQRETFSCSIENWIKGDLRASGNMFPEPNDIIMDEGSLDGYLATHEDLPDSIYQGVPLWAIKLERPTGSLGRVQEASEYDAFLEIIKQELSLSEGPIDEFI
jgi:hypothetical protein